jgi:hypothetical protein
MAVWAVAGAAAQEATIAPARLRCEYQQDPIGLDTARPQLSWICQAVDAGGRGLRQTAYQLLVASCEARLQEGKADRWDSGKIVSDQSTHVAYAGRPLASRERCFWKVRLWDQKGRLSAWSPIASFAVGLLAPGDWTARWITRKQGRALRGPMPIFRKEFDVARPIRRALVHVCGLGHYELSLNGGRVGDRVLDPGWTNYRKTCPYSTYDVTGQLTLGHNALGVMLGNGMYNVVGGRYVKFRGSFGPPKLILQLELQHPDGTTTIVTSDGSWKTAPGPIRFSCTYGGEDYDARHEMPGWNRAGFDDAAWQPVQVVEGPGGELRAQSNSPVRVQEDFRPVRVTEPRPGVFVYDFGQNCSGWPRLTVRGSAGATVKLIPGELLEPSGLVSQRSSGGPMWFSYTLRGGKPETWSPRFSYYGFRYLQVEGAAPDGQQAAADLPRIIDLRSQFLHNSAEVVGDFRCSNELVNRTHGLIVAAIRSNLQSVLTDCPHREKLGWLEVSHLLARGIMYNYEVPRLYAKISQDMRESQLDNGLVPDVAPEYTKFTAGFRDSPEWGSACALNPWHVWQMYGDRRLMKRQYDVMRRYVDYLAGTAKDHIVSHGLGDWYDIGPRGPGASQLTSTGLTATAIYYADLQVVAEAARSLVRADDARHYAECAAQVRVAFNRRFFDPKANRYDRGSQTAQAMPLVLGLAEPAHRAAVLANLVRDIRARGNRVTAGDVGFMYVVRALDDGGRGDVLYDMVCQADGPGYADQLRKGATTLTEAWDANPASSQNHCMLGHAEEWFYSGLAGIVPDAAAPGFQRIVLRAQPVGDLAWVTAHYDSVQGRITSQWKIAAGRFLWDITIPPNTTATVYVPAKDPGAVTESGRPAGQAVGVRPLPPKGGQAIFEVQSGSYRFAAPR